MPEGYTHVRIARRAAKGVHYHIQYPAAFAAGANGPDSLFCFEIWKSAAKRRYDLPGLGTRMHDVNTGAFLRSLVTRVSTRPQVEYVLGFLSHYAADTVMHPYVYAMCQPGMPYGGPGGHGYFEIALDSTLHAEDTGVSLVPAEDTSPLMKGEELADVTSLLAHCLSDAYGVDIPLPGRNARATPLPCCGRRKSAAAFLWPVRWNTGWAVSRQMTCSACWAA